jgi:DNA polymerase
VHGSLRRAGGRFIFPMYHPAAALHQASLRETLFADIRGLPAALLMARDALEAERVASVIPAAAAASLATTDRAGDEQQLTLFEGST